MSENYLILTKANAELRSDREALGKRSAQLEEQSKVLNRSSAELTSDNLLLTSKSAELTEKIVHLTSTNSRLSREVERLVRSKTQLEEEKHNLSQTVGRLVNSNAQRQEEQQQLSEISLLLRDEILQLKDRNRQLSEMNNRYEAEATKRSDCENASQSNAALQEHNGNLQSALTTQRQKAKEREEQVVAQINSTREALNSLDLYCPVVNPRTKGACTLFSSSSFQSQEKGLWLFGMTTEPLALHASKSVTQENKAKQRLSVNVSIMHRSKYNATITTR